MVGRKWRNSSYSARSGNCVTLITNQNEAE
ncbi:DUF397 domain-containing protein [Bacillus haikouensis]|nr:DUF397 domain-containing protein [Bacillus haikouensis]